MAGSGTLRPCACGCGELVDPRGGRLYFDPRHRQRAYRRRVQAELRARGLPATLNLQTAQTTSTPRTRNGDAPGPRQARQPRRLTPGQVRLSYPKALDVVTAALRHLNVPEPERRARRELDAVLTDRQREAVRG